ncbi:MAG: hypothetical protein KTR21_10715 [Rhodobacteraceae bacterium]|nr:hypothetical protein [Paracoccaceae bacterium]
MWTSGLVPIVVVIISNDKIHGSSRNIGGGFNGGRRYAHGGVDNRIDGAAAEKKANCAASW